MIDKMQEEFEKWASGKGLILSKATSGNQFYYLFEDTDYAWEGWQAARTVPEGLPIQQESKYTVSGSFIINRATGEAIPHDEPVFIFRARDIHAREAIESYACVLTPGAHRDAVCARINEFAVFSYAHPERMKTPDTLLSAAPEPKK